MKWKLVPEEPAQQQIDAAWEFVQTVPQKHDTMRGIYLAMTAAAPQPEHDSMTKEEAQAKQDWKGMDGAIAFHLIERHADGWHQTGEMMQAWLDANKSA